MTTASEADLLRRNLHLQQQVDAARAELSREAEANRLLQEELKALRIEVEDDAEARASYTSQAEDMEEMYESELLGRQKAEHERDTYRTVIESMLVASLYVGCDDRTRALGKSIGATVKARAGGDDEVVWTETESSYSAIRAAGSVELAAAVHAAVVKWLDSDPIMARLTTGGVDARALRTAYNVRLRQAIEAALA